MNQNSKIKNIVLTAVFAAVIYISTALLFHIPTGINNGYIHLGDAFIYLAAVLLPMPYGLVAAAIGAGLADVLTGSVIWLIPTLLIKPTMALLFTNKNDSIICKRNILSVFGAGIITIVGYYIAEGIIFGNFVAPMVGVLPNFVQALGSGCVFLVMGYAFDKINIKKRVSI